MSVANRRRLMVLAHTGATQYGLPACEALIELPLVAAGVLESMTDGPVRVYMAMGTEDVAVLEEFMLARQGMAGLRRLANPEGSDPK